MMAPSDSTAAVPQSMLVLGGSSMYVLLLLKAIDAAQLWPAFARITLFGRNAVRLAFIARAGAAMAQARGAACRIDYATDYQACVDDGYDLVFNQIRFGGLEMRDLDERTALASGFAADETLGMVGISNAIRTIDGLTPYLTPYLTAHGEPAGAGRKAPRWINFTNPCSIVTQHLVDTLGPAAAIGICDYPVVFQRKIAAFLEVPQQELEIGYFGLNHFAFVHSIRHQGRELLPRMLERGAAFDLGIAAQAWLDYLVVPAWDLVFDPEPTLARQRAQGNRAGTLLDIEQTCQHLLDQGQSDPALFLALLAQRDCAWYELAVVPLLEKCLGRQPQGAIVNLPMGDVFGIGQAHSVVETNAMVDAGGARALALPEAVRANMLFEYSRGMKQAERLLLQGIVTEQPRLVFQACLLHPMIRSSSRIERYFDLLGASDPYMARFFKRRSPST